MKVYAIIYSLNKSEMSYWDEYLEKDSYKMIEVWNNKNKAKIKLKKLAIHDFEDNLEKVALDICEDGTCYTDGQGAYYEIKELEVKTKEGDKI